MSIALTPTTFYALSYGALQNMDIHLGEKQTLNSVYFVISNVMPLHSRPTNLMDHSVTESGY